MSTFVTQNNNFVGQSESQKQLASYHPPPFGVKPKGLGLPPTAVGFMKRNGSLRNLPLDNRESNRSNLGLRNGGLQTINENRQIKRPESDLGMYKSNSNLLGDKYPGMLPTLGLTKYKNVDLSMNKRNPYKI